jgi:mediator of RNA polymerase II transcription subunit 6
LSKILPEADSIRDWTPALGNVYKKPAPPNETEESTKPANKNTNNNSSVEAAMQASLEEAFFRHIKFGHEYMDEKVVTGEPGNFHFSTVPKPTSKPLPTTISSNTAKTTPAVEATKVDEKKGGKATDKSPKTTTNMPAKPKRRKSKGGPASAS